MLKINYLQTNSTQKAAVFSVKSRKADYLYRIMTDKLRAYLILHFCVFLWGFTAVLGKLISLQALPLVWWRVLLVFLSLFVIIPMTQLRTIDRQVLKRMLSIGMLVGVHWLCFYGAIKLSNASVAVTTMALTSFFSALIEPFILKTRIKWYELALGILILPGMALVVGNLDWSMRTGFGVGIASAFLAAVFTTFNKDLIEKHQPPALIMTMVEMFGGVIVTSAALPFVLFNNPALRIMPENSDWLWLALLVWGCTLLPYSLSLKSLRHISAFAANLTVNLEPIYGVVLAGLFFREDKDLSTGFYVGVLIVLLAVFSHPFLKTKFGTQEP